MITKGYRNCSIKIKTKEFVMKKTTYILIALSLLFFLNCYTSLEVKKTTIDTEPRTYVEYNSGYDDDYYYADMYLGYHYRYYDPFYYNRWWIGYSPYYYYYYNPYDFYDYYPDIVVINNYTYKSKYYSGKRYKSKPKKIITSKNSSKVKYNYSNKVKMSKFFKPVYIAKNKNSSNIGSGPVLIQRKNSNYGSSGTMGSKKLVKPKSNNSNTTKKKTYKNKKSNIKVKTKSNYTPTKSFNKTNSSIKSSYKPVKKTYNYQSYKTYNKKSSSSKKVIKKNK